MGWVRPHTVKHRENGPQLMMSTTIRRFYRWDIAEDSGLSHRAPDTGS